MCDNQTTKWHQKRMHLVGSFTLGTNQVEPKRLTDNVVGEAPLSRVQCFKVQRSQHMSWKSCHITVLSYHNQYKTIHRRRSGGFVGTLYPFVHTKIHKSMFCAGTTTPPHIVIESTFGSVHKTILQDPVTAMSNMCALIFESPKNVHLF